MSIEISLVQLPQALTQLHLPELQITSVETEDRRPIFDVLHKGSKVWEVTLGQIEQNMYVVNHMPPPNPRLVASALRELSKVGREERQVLRSGRPHGSVLVGWKILSLMKHAHFDLHKTGPFSLYRGLTYKEYDHRRGKC